MALIINVLSSCNKNGIICDSYELKEMDVHDSELKKPQHIKVILTVGTKGAA